MELLRNCKVMWTKKFVFPDCTEITDEYEAILYYDKYYEILDNLKKRFFEYVNSELYEFNLDHDKFEKYNKDIINNFKKEYYNILWNIHKDFSNHNKIDKCPYDEFFEKFANNPENDMQGAARCIHNMPYNWNNLKILGDELLAFDDKGRRFMSFNAKCNFLDEENR